MQLIIIAIIASYLLGSIPSAYIFGRLLKGVDIRKHGSGNMGATNAMRVLGKGPGIAVLIIDALKGFIAVAALGSALISRGVPISADVTRLLLALACVCGHNWTVFLGFKGGKGVATTAGTLIAMAVETPGLWSVLGVTIALWIAVMLLTRIVSLATLLAAVSFPFLTFVFGLGSVYVFMGIVLCGLIVYRHKANIARLIQGKELAFKNAKSTS